MHTMIAPSLLAADAGCWGQEIGLVIEEGITCIHLDIMDGRFVPNLTFGPGPVGMLRKYGDLEFDAHLMVVEPEALIPAFAKAGVDSVTVHQEACTHLHRVLEMVREQGMKPGAAVNPSTPVEMLAPVLPFLARVLVMTVNPGFGGQKAILSMLGKVKWLKHRKAAEGLDFQIQVDGGVGQDNLSLFLDAGAENLVIGSALFQPGKTRENIKTFHKLISDYEVGRTGF
jgi:ribulose-phosphate 3-epimerase